MLDKNNSLVIIYFTYASYQFLRIKTENGIMFQRITKNELIFYELKAKVLLIFQFVISKNLEFTEQRIARMIGKFMDKQSKTLNWFSKITLSSVSEQRESKYLLYAEIRRFNKNYTFFD